MFSHLSSLADVNLHHSASLLEIVYVVLLILWGIGGFYAAPPAQPNQAGVFRFGPTVVELILFVIIGIMIFNN